MPINLSSIGYPSPYGRPMRFLPWAVAGLAFNLLGVALVLLFWPEDQPASGAKFWTALLGLPNAIFIAMLGMRRIVYEGQWYRAHWRNVHRKSWIAEKVFRAQRPLYVLGAAYSLPSPANVLSNIVAKNRFILKPNSQGLGSGQIACNRFNEVDLESLAFLGGDAEEAEHSKDVDQTRAYISIQEDTQPRPPTPPVTQILRATLAPLAITLKALTRYERDYWPKVRILVEPELADERMAQVQSALHLSRLPALEVEAIAADKGMLIADLWLDALETHPLLVIAVAWHADDIANGQTEACAAVLLDPGCFELPDGVRRLATLHRPVATDIDAAAQGFATAATWGKTNPASVTRAWITRPIERCGLVLKAAGFATAGEDTAQCHLDTLIGDAGAANGLLSIAAAIESPATTGPQLIVDHTQAAILHVLLAGQPAFSNVEIETET